ncbi:MAG: tetratricopeptide repeat protein [Phocaeicola coprocola]
MLLKLGEDYQSGREVAGVVLNDLGTIYQEGIGVGRDGLKAEYWFKQAYLQGDHLYAPTNLGDLYRKGCGELPSSLPLAFEAYRKSEDIYALYRIGQAYEEGWTRYTGYGKSFVLVSESSRKKASSGSTKTGRFKQ